MIRYKLIVCWKDRTWTTDYVTANSCDSEQDVIDGYIEEYNKKTENSTEIVFVGIDSWEGLD